MVANLILEILELLTKEIEIVNSGCISNLSLRRRQWLIEGAEKVAWLFNTAKKPFKFPFTWLLCFAVAKTELIVFCFSFLSGWKLSKALLGLLQLVLIKFYTYKIDQTPYLFTQVWWTIYHLWVRRKRNISISIIIIIGQVFSFLIFLPINSLVFSMYFCSFFLFLTITKPLALS